MAAQAASRQAVDRREFLSGAAGLTLALTILPHDLAVTAAAADAPFPANAWVTIAADGAITIVSPPAEMGQGTFTAMGAALAEELDADWSKVTLVHPPVWDEKTYGNP